MTAHLVDLAIARLARRQHGAFTRAQALGVGATRRMIERRLATGRWIRLARGVYALPGNPFTWHRQCMAATLAIPGAVISGRAAAALHRFPGFAPGRVVVTVPRGSNHRSTLAVVHESGLVEVTRVQRIPVVTAAHAVIEVARHLDSEGLGRLVDRLDDEDPRVLPAVRDRYVALARSRMPGIERVCHVLDERGDGYVPPESELEELLAKVLNMVPGIPPVLRQARPPWRSSAASRVDVLIPDWSAIVEADGRRWHTRVSDFEADRERDNDAVVHGYRPLRFTWHQLTQRRAYVLDTLDRLRALPRVAAAA